MKIPMIGPLNPTYQSIHLQISSKGIMAYFTEALTAGQIAYSPRMHIHPNGYYEIILFQKGTSRIITNEMEEIVREGSVAIVAPGFSHRLDMTEEAEIPQCATFFVVPDDKAATDSDGRLAEQFFSEITDIVILPDIGENFHFIKDAVEELHTEENCYVVIAANAIENFIIALMRTYFKSAVRPKSVRQISTDKHRMMQIEDFLSRAVTEDLQCSDLARSLHLSVRQLERMIKTLYGKSYRSILYEMRMKYARQLLAESALPLQEISELLGYTSVNAFHSSYRRFFGDTPIRFRKVCQEERTPKRPEIISTDSSGKGEYKDGEGQIAEDA